jgi:predicted DNA-binding protein with PD1-like motif
MVNNLTKRPRARRGQLDTKVRTAVRSAASASPMISPRSRSFSFPATRAGSPASAYWLKPEETKEYGPSVSLDEQVELLSLIGDVALKDGEPQVHAHVVIGKRDGTAHGGHLLQAHVRPTCELVLTESPAHLRKEFDPAAGVALIKL